MSQDIKYRHLPVDTEKQLRCYLIDIQNIVYESINEVIDICDARVSNPSKYLSINLNASLAEQLRRTTVKAIGFEYMWDLYRDNSGEGFIIYLEAPSSVSPKAFVSSSLEVKITKRCEDRGYKIKEIFYVDKETCDLCENNKIFLPLW